MLYNNQTTTLLELLTMINPSDVIPVLQEGIETERLKLLLSGSPEAARRIRQARVLLALLYTNELGVNKQQPV